MKTLIQAFILCFCLTSCDIINPNPPMFSCRVNLKHWEPEISGPLGGRYTGNAVYRINKGYFDIYGSSEDFDIGISIKFTPNSKIELNKKYSIEIPINENGAGGYFGKKSSTNSSQNIIVKAKSGFIVITKMDTQYFSGSFEFDLEKEIESKTYKIRKGQFNDMLYAKDDN